MKDDVALLTGTELLAKLRAREFSSRELLDLYLRRIEKLDPTINAVVTLDVERARKRADEADAARTRGALWGPLHGLPMTIKDTFEVAGMRTTAGAPELKDHVPVRSAVAAQRLIDAGAVIFGKTNTPIYAGDVQSYNEIFGVTKNPWNAEHTPGGSSGGAGAAVAAGLTSVEYGSDIGGSIRTPSNWNGIYGHKPTFGIVPVRGHIPGPPGSLAEVDLGVMGPMARGADDLALLLDVTAGPLPDRARAWKLQLPAPRRGKLQEYRVAAWLDDPAFPVDAEVKRLLQESVQALRRSGVEVTEADPEGVDLAQTVDIYLRLLSPIIIAGFPQPVFDQLTELAAKLPADDPSTMAMMARYGTARHRDWVIADAARQRHRARLEEFFEKFDVLLCPVTPVTAIRHDHSDPMVNRSIEVNGEPRPYWDLFAWISVATMAHLPASVAPIGNTRHGLPVGAQIVGPYLEDHTTIDFARRLAAVVGGFQAPPGF